MAHCNVMIYQQVTLSGDAEWPKVADAVIEASTSTTEFAPYLGEDRAILQARGTFRPTDNC
jgi:hypothetical protein